MLRTTLVLLAFFLLSPVRAAEGGGNCTGTITSLPATLSTQGTWCLSQHASTPITTGAAITISANNVTLDCNDFKVGGLPGNVNTNTVGVLATNALNVTVRNCTIRGFIEGIRLAGTASGGLIENNRLEQNFVAGIRVAGDGHVVRRNRIVDTGGRPAWLRTDGIASTADHSWISDNSIVSVTVTGDNGDVVGIACLGNASEIVRNFISGLAPDDTGTAVAISTGASAGSSIHRNQMLSHPVSLGTAILSGADNQCGSNNHSGWGWGIVGRTDAGSNFGN